MAVNFSMTRNGETQPTKLVDVDVAICEMLGQTVDPVNWIRGWYDSIGLMLACGRDWPYIREAVKGYYFEDDLLLICDFLAANYSSDCWGSR